MAMPVYLWLKDDGGNAVRGSVDAKDREGSIEIIELMHTVELPTDDNTGKVFSKRLHGDYFLIKSWIVHLLICINDSLDKILVVED